MATIELSTLAEHFDSDEIASIVGAIADVTAEDFSLKHEGETIVIDNNIDDDVFTDFRDRLEANESDAYIFVPVEFEEIVTVGEYRVGSSQALLLVLESLREDFFVEETEEEVEEEEEEEEAEDEIGFDEEIEDDEDDDFEDDEPEEEDEAARYYSDENTGIEMKDEQLRHIWRCMQKAAKLSVQKGLCLFLID